MIGPSFHSGCQVMTAPSVDERENEAFREDDEDPEEKLQPHEDERLAEHVEGCVELEIEAGESQLALRP